MRSVVPLETHPGSDTAPDALNVMPSAARWRRLPEMAGLLARLRSYSAWSGPRVARSTRSRRTRGLEVDLLHARSRRHLHEGRQFRDRLFKPVEPATRGTVPALALLRFAKGAHIPEDRRKILARMAPIGLAWRRRGETAARPARLDEGCAGAFERMSPPSTTASAGGDPGRTPRTAVVIPTLNEEPPSQRHSGPSARLGEPHHCGRRRQH